MYYVIKYQGNEKMEGVLKMIIDKRIELLKAMGYIASCINDDDIMERWLMCGIPDGDTNFANYCEDEELEDIIHEFLVAMSRAKKSGGLYCDGIVGQ